MISYDIALEDGSINKRHPFGISCCYTSANAENISSGEYFDYMMELGAKFAWFFTYMPVGKGAVTELMATAGQCEMMYRKIREYRRTKPLFTMDFWNDGEKVQIIRTWNQQRNFMISVCA